MPTPRRFPALLSLVGATFLLVSLPIPFLTVTSNVGYRSGTSVIFPAQTLTTWQFYAGWVAQTNAGLVGTALVVVWLGLLPCLPIWSVLCLVRPPSLRLSDAGVLLSIACFLSYLIAFVAGPYVGLFIGAPMGHAPYRPTLEGGFYLVLLGVPLTCGSLLVGARQMLLVGIRPRRNP